MQALLAGGEDSIAMLAIAQEQSTLERELRAQSPPRENRAGPVLYSKQDDSGLTLRLELCQGGRMNRAPV